MKIVLEGTNHSKNDEPVDVAIDYMGDDTWTFEFGKVNITVTDLSASMIFLKEQFGEEVAP